MPAILQLDWNGRTSYDENDILTIHPVRWEFGSQELLVGVPVPDRVFAYVYCTDIVPDGPRARAALDTNRRSSELPGLTGEDMKRRYRIVLADFGGRTDRFTVHVPWGADGSGVPNNKKYTWAQLVGASRDKRPAGGRLRES